MMQKLPKKLKFNKSHKIKTYKGLKAKKLNFFQLGLKTKNKAQLTWNNFESFRKVYVRFFRSKEIKNKKNFKLIQSMKKKKKKKRIIKKKRNSLIFKAHFYSGLTKKPLQVRMGKGKGSVYKWVFPCNTNRILIEQSTNIRKRKLIRVFQKATKKMPLRLKLIWDKKKSIFPFRLKNFFFYRKDLFEKTGFFYNVFKQKKFNEQ